MNKKIFASALLAVVGFVITNAASAVTYDNSVTDVGGKYNQTNNAIVGAGGPSVRANDLIITAQTSGIGADIPANGEIVIRLPEGLNFDGAPTYLVSPAVANNGLTLKDASQFGDPTLTEPGIALFDTNGDGGMDRAVVTVKAAADAGDQLYISSNIKSPAGTAATKTGAKASIIVNGGLAVSQVIADIVDSLPETVAGASTANLSTAPSIGQQNVALPSPTIVVTIPAGTVGSKTITITPASGLKWATATTNATITKISSPVSSTYVAPTISNIGAASGTNSITLITAGVGAPTEASKFDVQLTIALDAVNVSAGATGARGVTIAGTAGVAGTANLVNVLANGSTADLTSTKVIPTNKVVDIVAGSSATQTLPAIDISENFAGDAASLAGTPTITIVPGAGLAFSTATGTITVTGGTATVSVNTAPGPTKGHMVITFSARDGGKSIRLSGIQATAGATASGNLSVTVGGGTTDQTTAPKQAVVVAKAVPVGSVSVKLGDKKKGVTGPTGAAGALTATITLTESTYGSLTTVAQSQTENAFFKISPSTGSTIQAVTFIANSYPSTAPVATCSAENVPNSTAWICLVTTESTAITATTSTISVKVNYYGNAKSTIPGSPPAAVVGSTIELAFSGNSGVSGTVAIADVVISTTLSRGAVPDLVPGNTQAQKLAALTITEAFGGAITAGNFRLIAPTGVTFNNADAILPSVLPAGAITATPTITATFSPNDTLVFAVAVPSSTITFQPQAIIGPNASGFLAFQVVNGDINGASGANITAETINLAYADGTLAPFKVGNAISLNTGFSATNTATGGLTPYLSATSSDKSVATVKLSGSSITVTAVGVGSAVITVKDSLDNPKTIDVTVTASAAQPVSEKVKASDGSTTAATFSSGASTDGGDSFADTFTTADDVTIVGTINVDPADQGTDGAVYVAVLAKTGSGTTLSYIDENGNFMDWDGTVAGLGENIVATPLADVYNVQVYSGNLAAGTFRVALAYADRKSVV